MKTAIRILAFFMFLVMIFLLPSYTFGAEAASGCRDWGALMRLPSEEEISDFNRTSTKKAPYLQAWMDTEDCGRFDAIAVDFKADYLPAGTYCSQASFKLDYSALYADYGKVEGHYISGYAGFQYQPSSERRNSILSFWDVFCSDPSGKTAVVHPLLISPEGEEAERFDWEDTGVMYLHDYPWQAGKWYRMMLQCGHSESSGNTTMEYWVRDLETMAWTRLCIYDLSVPNVTFQGNTAVFLENFDESNAGAVRSMEIKNFRVHNFDKNEWIDVESGSFSKGFDYPGSYQYGSDGECFWMISSGIPNLAPKQEAEYLRVKNTESGSPF